jgi:hypothetical protein
MRSRPTRHKREPIAALRLAIDCMPVATREAMLEGVRANERILVGAYVDGQGGMCPMLAAHRRGGRTDFLSFAKSWDRFARARGKARAATGRELAILVSQLEASLSSSDALELDRAISDHRRLRGARLRRMRRLLDGMEPRGEIIALRACARRRPGSEDVSVSGPVQRPETLVSTPD